MIIKQLITFFTLILLSSQIDCQLSYDSFVQNFANCKWDSENFDKCVKDGLNSVRPFFKAGIPELNIGSFDPFFAKEVTQTRGGNNLNYKLKLRNVYERGWTQSSVTKFKCNWRKRFIQYTQHFPEKFLEGEYEFDGTVMTGNMKNKGTWNMTLYDYVQTTTLTRPNNSKDIKVRIEVQQIGNMDLHISNLLRGRTVMENMLDRMINASWRPGFAVIRPLINDIVSTAFTEIFNKNFKDLDVNNIIPRN
ncbi:juvenile hormone binding protein 16 [Rhodnius prolixus]|uniref:juvenile hormone binding protein 16 n=1 Tax=Rhodnius prolixus TaxID=13249 RepID=UPI003D188530